MGSGARIPNERHPWSFQGTFEVEQLLEPLEKIALSLSSNCHLHFSSVWFQA